MRWLDDWSVPSRGESEAADGNKRHSEARGRSDARVSPAESSSVHTDDDRLGFRGALGLPRGPACEGCRAQRGEAECCGYQKETGRWSGRAHAPTL